VANVKERGKRMEPKGSPESSVGKRRQRARTVGKVRSTGLRHRPHETMSEMGTVGVEYTSDGRLRRLSDHCTGRWWLRDVLGQTKKSADRLVQRE